MFFNIIFSIIISIIIIFVVHNVFNYLKNTLTVPKVKDLINKPKTEYNKINNLINTENNDTENNDTENNDTENNDSHFSIKAEKNKENKFDSEQIKSELTDFFKELNNNKSENNILNNNIPNNNIPNNNIPNNNILDYETYNSNNIEMNF